MAKLFSAFSLIDESASVISITNPAGFKDESYFIEGVEFLSKIRTEHTIATAKLYKIVSESSTNRIAVREGFSEFFGSIKSFIKKIIDFIKKLLSKFWVRINGIFLRDKYIESHKSELSKFETKHEFDINGFTYTFSDSVPSTSVLMDIGQSISDFSIEDAGTPKKAKTYEELKRAYDSFMEKKTSNKHLDSIRKDCIGTSSDIAESDFKDELFKIYRNGDSSKSKITVTSTIVTEALSFFSNYDKIKQQTQRYSDNVEKLYREIQKKLDRVQTTSVSGQDQVSIEDILDSDTTTGKIALYDLFMKAKSQEIQEVSNLHVMAFSSKLDAISEDFSQSKAILYTAFKKILAKNEEVVFTEALDEFSSFKSSLMSRLNANPKFKAFMKGKSEHDKSVVLGKLNNSFHSTWESFKGFSKKRIKTAKAGWAFAVNDVLVGLGIDRNYHKETAEVEDDGEEEYFGDGSCDDDDNVDIDYLCDEAVSNFFVKAE